MNQRLNMCVVCKQQPASSLLVVYDMRTWWARRRRKVYATLEVCLPDINNEAVLATLKAASSKEDWVKVRVTG